ncbi:MAG: tRNA preQ1(34) S-adenosylmethionine ribosyltransferase-isomerase QueA [Candidatus Eiseniibacteriota bacterium]
MSFRRSDYAYRLPEAQIASRPEPTRSGARLLVVRRQTPPGTPADLATVADLGRFLGAGDCLVLNETRVRPARLYGVRWGTGGGIEVLLVRRLERQADGAEVWEVLCRPGKRLKPGTRFLVADELLRGEVLHHRGRGRRAVRLEPTTAGGTVDDAIECAGHVPLPPYIRRADDVRDREDYQTVFARVPGAVAAPTAGLHFTPELLAGLGRAGISIVRLVLHVGPGTFTPVVADDVREHRLDPEPFELPATTAAAINASRAAGGRIVAVGTTVVRVLETQARRAGADETVVPGSGETDLFIVPPFEFKAVDVMLTNFHLPESTLLMLVAAFVGRERILDAYAQAVAADFRFYSYGDATLLIR